MLQITKFVLCLLRLGWCPCTCTSLCPRHWLYHGGRPASQGSASHFNLQSSLLLLIFLEQNKIGTCQIGKEKRERIYIYSSRQNPFSFPGQRQGLPPSTRLHPFLFLFGGHKWDKSIAEKEPVQDKGPGTTCLLSSLHI